MRTRLLPASLLVPLLALLQPALAGGQPTFITSWSSVGIPLGLLLDGAGHLYATCEHGGGAALRKFSLSGSLLGVFGADDPFEGYGAARLRDGSVAVADYYGCRVRRFTADGVLVASWPTGGRLAVYLAVDEQDNIYVTDGDGDRIRKFSTTGALLAEWASPHPTGIACFGDFVYVAARNDGIIARYGRDGTLLASFLSGMTAVEQLAVDAYGDLYAADWGAYQLRKFSPDGILIWTIGSAVPGYSFGPLRHHGVAVADDGTLYVGDYEHRRVLVFGQEPTAAVSTSWGAVKQRYR